MKYISFIDVDNNEEKILITKYYVDKKVKNNN